ncbi:unnamed protein product, partial [Vitis vinifera]
MYIYIYIHTFDGRSRRNHRLRRP